MAGDLPWVLSHFVGFAIVGAPDQSQFLPQRAGSSQARYCLGVWAEDFLPLTLLAHFVREHFLHFTAITIVKLRGSVISCGGLLPLK